MATIYIVTAGEYSDYSIYGAFSTKENAQAYIDKRKAGDSWFDDANIEEWGIDEGLKQCLHTRWYLGMYLDDGVVRESVRSSESFGFPSNSIDGINSVAAAGNRPLVRVQSVESAEHAMKLAVEARQAWLRGELPCR